MVICQSIVYWSIDSSSRLGIFWKIYIDSLTSIIKFYLILYTYFFKCRINYRNSFIGYSIKCHLIISNYNFIRSQVFNRTITIMNRISFGIIWFKKYCWNSGRNIKICSWNSKSIARYCWSYIRLSGKCQNRIIKW